MAVLYDYSNANRLLFDTFKNSFCSQINEIWRYSYSNTKKANSEALLFVKAKDLSENSVKIASQVDFQDTVARQPSQKNYIGKWKTLLIPNRL